MDYSIEDHIKLVQNKKKQFKDISEKHFPNKFWMLEICLAVRSILLIDGITLPFMLVLLGPASAGKSTVISMIKSLGEEFSVDSFTPKAFVTQMASKSEEELKKIDLLKKIENKIFLTSDLGPIFSLWDDKLREIFGILTRVLDGQGYRNISGAHSERGYDKIMFVWIGATVDVPKNVWPVIAQLGPKMYFLRINIDVSYKEEQETILKNIHGIRYDEKLQECFDVLKEYWNAIISFPVQKNGKIEWDYSRDNQRAIIQIVEYAQLLARLRGHVPVDDTEKKHGSEYPFLEPKIEDPNRASQSLLNLAKGNAVCNGRNYITEDDVTVIRRVVFSSASKERIELLKLLIKNNGELTTTQFCQARRVTRTTALRTMKMLEILGLVDKVKISGTTKDNIGIHLKEEFRWLLEKK